MKNDYTAQFLVGTFTAIVTAVFNLVVVGQVNWLWLIIAFTVPFLVLQLYQTTGFSPFKEWRVTNDVTGLRASMGKADGKGAWEFDEGTEKTNAIYGPYKPLGRGRYRATFFIKVNKYSGDDAVADIDVAVRHGRKLVALRRLTANDFQRIDEYQGFPLDFYLLQDENESEFRMTTKGANCRLTLDHVTLSRRLL